jgi:hypothetical protein
MAHFNNATVAAWRTTATAWLAGRNFTLADVKTGRDAWTVAHQSGIVREAYADHNVVDAHIQTALQAIFTNAVFKDRKVY